ncbi:patched family protein [Ostertagia ostertagi]
MHTHEPRFFYLTPTTDAVYLYTPTDAPSKTERQIIHDLWPLTEDNYVPGRAVTQSREAQLTVVAKNGGNILLPEYARAIKRLDMYIQNRIRVKFRNKTYTYRDLCLRWKKKGCPGNGHIQVISELYNHGINITYPTFRMGSKSGYLGAGLGGVSLSKDDNGTVILAAAKAWLLVYQLKFFPTNVSYVSGVWEKSFKMHMDHYPVDPYITITYFHSQTLAEELKRNADSLVPRFIAAFVILVVFAVICSLVTIKAVGTDNMFLMVAAVKRTSRVLPVEERIGECMADAAVSILITALTDAFSFGVGTITTIPAVQIFCIYTCCALVLTFLYQVAASASTRLLWLGSRTHPDPTHESNRKRCAATKFFQDWYAPILMQPAIKALAALWYCIYVGFAIYGCFHLREGLEPVNLLVDDSYAKPHYLSLERHFWHYGATLQAFYEMASHYLYTHDADPWMEDVKWTLDEHERPYISAFRFLIGMRDISSTTEQQKATKSFRQVAAIFPEYNVTTFMPLWLFTDQYDLVVPNTVQDIVIAVLCMLFIAFLLIPQPFCALWVAFTIGSIDLGVLGYMTLWGVNLDAISMITIIMSVGFSVDYSAHITYGYVISKEPDPRDRVRDALGDLGWPVVQGIPGDLDWINSWPHLPSLMLSLFVRGFCTIGSRKLDDEPESVAISTRAPPSVSDCSTLQKRHPPPETPPPRPPMLPPPSFQQQV